MDLAAVSRSRYSAQAGKQAVWWSQAESHSKCGMSAERQGVAMRQQDTQDSTVGMPAETAARPDCRACVCCQSTGDLQEVSEFSRCCSDGDSHISHTWTDSNSEPGVTEQPGTHRMSSLGLRVLHVQVADVLAEAAKGRVQAMWHSSLALVGALLLAEQAAVPGKPYIELRVGLWLLLSAQLQRCLAWRACTISCKATCQNGFLLCVLWVKPDMCHST